MCSACHVRMLGGMRLRRCDSCCLDPSRIGGLLTDVAGEPRSPNSAEGTAAQEDGGEEDDCTPIMQRLTAQSAVRRGTAASRLPPTTRRCGEWTLHAAGSVRRECLPGRVCCGVRGCEGDSVPGPHLLPAGTIVRLKLRRAFRRVGDRPSPPHVRLWP